MHSRRLVLALALSAACAGTTPEATAPATTIPQPTSSTVAATPPPTRTVVTTMADPAPAPCATGDSFAAAGDIGTVGSIEGDATAVSAVRWADHGSCERVVIQFADSGGEPADLAGVTSAAFAAGRRIVRVQLGSGVRATAIADVFIDNPLAERVYVVRGLDGELFVDIHLGAAATSRVFTLDEPGRVVVDLQPGEEDPEAPGVRGDVVVVTEPRPLEAVSGQIRVAGYARTFEAQVHIAVTRAGGELAEVVTSAADWAETWGQFDVTVAVGELGPVGLTVGAPSPATGQFEGVRLTVEVV